MNDTHSQHEIGVLTPVSRVSSAGLCSEKPGISQFALHACASSANCSDQEIHSVLMIPMCTQKGLHTAQSGHGFQDACNLQMHGNRRSCAQLT